MAFFLDSDLYFSQSTSTIVNDTNLPQQESDFERREEQWNDLRRNLEEQIHSLKAELKERDEAYMAKNKGEAASQQ